MKLTIEVPTPAVEAETGRVLQELRKHAHLPGFRKGKVPQKVIARRFRKEVRQELVERLLPRYWEQAKAEKSLDPLIPPSVEELELEEGQPMTIQVMGEVRPEIVLGDVESFDLPEAATEPDETEVEDALADVRRNFAEWQVVDRPAANGDLIVGWIRELDPPASEDGDGGGTEAAAGEGEAGDREAGAEQAAPAEAPDPADTAGDSGATESGDRRPFHVEIGGRGVSEALS
ncbi:MAG: hypothetical protein MI919_34225, partial [Holophagales bacterium]|nr:hypothetical protein [Holophagales bacterium]